jgi:Flp pilus assembly protein TadD
LLGLAAIAGVTLWLLRRKKPEAFWILWFAITLAPMLNIIPFRSMMQDRYMYLALLGPLALAGSTLDRMTRATARRTVAVAASALVAVSVILTVRQVEYWSSPVAFWVRDATVRPLYASDTMYEPDDYAQKLSEMEAAVHGDPDNPILLNNLGGLHYMAGRVPQALSYFEKSKRLDPNEPLNLINLGRIYTRLRRFEDAQRSLTRATEIWPHDSMACHYLLQLNLEARDVTSARRTLDKCAKLRDGFERERAELRRLEQQRTGAER